MEIQQHQLDRLNTILKSTLNCKFWLTTSKDNKLIYLKIIDTPYFGDRNFSFTLKEIEAIILFDVIKTKY